MSVALLVSGCSGTSGDEYRIVTPKDVEQPSAEATDSPLPVAEADREAAPEAAPAVDEPTPQEDLPAVDPGAADLARPIKLLVPERTFSNEGADGTLRVSFDDLDLEAVLNVTKPPPDIVDHFPDWLAGLDGRRIRIRGFMSPAFQASDLMGFVMGRDLSCFFGPNQKIYHLIEVKMRDGVTTEYLHNVPFDVEGILQIRPDADGDQLWQLYQMEDALVIED